MSNNNSDRYLAEYIKFMKKYSVPFGPDIPFTHSIVGKPGGKYNIPANKYAEFIEVYIKAYRDGGFHLVERPAENGPLLIDLDFRQECKERQYTNDDIVYIIKYSTDLIKKYYKISNKNELDAFVFEKEKPSKHQNSGYKDGFHIVYPYIPMSRNMRYLILTKTRDLVLKDGALAHIKYTNDFIKEVFDLSIVKSNGWMIYGSNKQDSLPYWLKAIYSCTLEKKDINKFKFGDLVRLLGNRKFETHKEHEYNEKINQNDLKKTIDNMLSKMIQKKDTTKFVNKDNKKQKNKSDADDEQEFEEEIKFNSKKKVSTDSKLCKYDNIQLAKKLVDLLSNERATNYQDWIHVGWALYNTSPKLLNHWKKFSQRTTKNNYDEQYCERFWNEPKKKENKLTIGSLHIWAKTDNPEGYANLMRENISEMLLDAETGTEYDIAKIMYELYGHRFVCSDIKNNHWYEFQDNIWVSIEEGYTLHNLISEELIKEYAYLQMSILGDIINKKGGERDNASKRNENIQKITNKLKRPGFKDGIVTECRRKFYDKKFEEKLDSNLYLIGFNDGVYDLENMCFRKGLPDDYVSLTVGYDYPKEYNVNHPDVKWVDDFLSRVQVEADMNEYLKMLLASYIDGNTQNETFVIWTGKGANGKSKTIEFFTKAFGDYCSTLPVTLLTGNRPPSGAATPELAEMKGKRFISFEEPEKTDNIKVGYMKDLTGGGEQTVRKLYCNPFKYKPQFKLLLACNKLPEIDANDGGTWRRLRVSPFDSHFVKLDDPNEKDRKKMRYKGQPLKKNEFPRDNKLSEHMITYKRAFAWVVINVYYPRYKEKNIVEPPKVLEYTNKYQKDNDMVFDFINSMITITKDNDDYETIVDVYKAFRDWIRDNGNRGRVGTSNDIKKYFEEMDPDMKITGKNIYGIQFKIGEDDDKDKNGVKAVNVDPLDK